eukprot:CAMPEP_0115876672 /NCGR_PEP_ID=MMETSP0287-20121206/25801_1 /TAXON_ID=412157 /ORGANISM="Chrysochromulina rotalis, Strain UIO044" /LENGTH=33 /DNA_ID= /DNA_START= /DNA_END= /DNA_ORIENTATION=
MGTVAGRPQQEQRPDPPAHGPCDGSLTLTLSGA